MTKGWALRRYSSLPLLVCPHDFLGIVEMGIYQLPSPPLWNPSLELKAPQNLFSLELPLIMVSYQSITK